jgi:hypothetical protein
MPTNTIVDWMQLILKHCSNTIDVEMVRSRSAPQIEQNSLESFRLGHTWSRSLISN